MSSRGLFYARLEETDWNFIRRLVDTRTFDAAIVKAAYLAPYPPGDSRQGEPADRLIKALDDRGLQWALDPATAAHGHHRAAEWTSPRVRACSMARAMPLPWDPTLLQRRDEAVVGLLSRADFLQRTSGAFAVPYFEMGGRDDLRIDANCSLIGMAAEFAGDRRPLAYLQTLRSRLRDGSAAAAAHRFIAAGAQTVMIRIRGIKPAVLEDVVAYLDLVDLIGSEGARPVADCTGSLGPVLVAGGADAFTSGARYFQAVPKHLLARRHETENKQGEEGRGGGAPIRYQVPGWLTAVDRDQADLSLPPCQVAGCRALVDGAGARERREHNLHEFKRLGGEAAAAGLAYSDMLRALPGELPRIWAMALDTCAAQRRAA
jgi:hypothetical protein